MAEIGRDVAYPDAIGKMVDDEFVGVSLKLVDPLDPGRRGLPVHDVMIKVERNHLATIVGYRFRGPDLYATILKDVDDRMKNYPRETNAETRRRNWQADARTYIVHGGKLNASEVVRLSFGEEFDDRLGS
jgi:hypothetical protein